LFTSLIIYIYGSLNSVRMTNFPLLLNGKREYTHNQYIIFKQVKMVGIQKI